MSETQLLLVCIFTKGYHYYCGNIPGLMVLWIFSKLFLSLHLSKQRICLCYLKHSVLYMLCHCEMNRVLD